MRFPPQKPDYLSRLPPELLTEIFELTYPYRRYQTTPLSKSLLPFEERFLFRELDVHSYESLKRLCTVAQRRPEALAYAKILRISIARETESKDMAKEVEDVGTPSNELVKLLFRKLTRMTSFHLFGSSRLVLLVLDSTVAASSFPNLIFLTLASTFRTIADPFHPALYTSLQYYSTVESVRIRVWRTPKSIQRYEKPLPEMTPFHNQLDQVSLDGPLTASLTSAKALLYSFGPLSSVFLTDTSKKTSRIYRIIDCLYESDKLRSLSLVIQHKQGSRPVLKDLAELTKLTSLGSLSFGGRAAPASLASLESLPLIALAFEKEAHVSLSVLTKLIAGDTKHKTLKRLELNNVEGMVGTTIEEMGEPYYDVDCDEWDVYPDWVLPDWSSDFDEDGLVEFLELAEKEGIEVEGTAVNAIGVDAEFDKEEAVLLELEEGLDECG